MTTYTTREAARALGCAETTVREFAARINLFPNRQPRDIRRYTIEHLELLAEALNATHGTRRVVNL